jgi:hypothetical protein
MSILEEFDRVIRARLSGTPSTDLRDLLGTQHYLGTLGKIGNIGTIGVVKHMGTLNRTGTVGLLNRAGTVGRLNVVGTLGKISKVGSINRIGTVGRLNQAGTVGRTNYIGRLGTIEYIGTIQRLNLTARIGTLGRVDRIGTCHTGTVPVTFAGQSIMAGADVQARYYSASLGRGTTPRLGCGSSWTGSWVDVDKYRNKTLMVKLAGTAAVGKGSVAIIGGMAGTGINDGTFTYYPWTSIGKGSAYTLSFTESMMYVRTKIRQHGGPGGSWQKESGGTVQVRWGRQV